MMGHWSCHHTFEWFKFYLVWHARNDVGIVVDSSLVASSSCTPPHWLFATLGMFGLLIIVSSKKLTSISRFNLNEPPLKKPWQNYDATWKWQDNWDV
jgi:hypothetical protein